MRNLKQYPITRAEKVAALEWAVAKADEHAGDRIGGIRPVAMREVLDDLVSQGTGPGDDQFEALALELATEWCERDNADEGHCGPYGTAKPAEYLDAARDHIRRCAAVCK